MWKRLAALLLVGVAAAAAAPQDAPPAIDAPKPQVAWRCGFTDAMRQARAEQRPLLVLFHADGDAEADGAAAKLWRDEKLVAKSASFLCLIASASPHEESVDELGARLCRRWGGVACADHQRTLVDAGRELLGAGAPVLPQLVLCTGEGRVLARRAFALKQEKLVELLDDALREVGPPGGAGGADPKADAERVAKALDDTKKARSTRKAEALTPALELGSEAARNALLEYVRKGDDDATRVAVMQALAVPGDYLVLETLQKISKEKQEYVALAAIDGLGKLRLPEPKEELKKLVSRFTGNDQGRVLRALAACGPADADVRELIVKKIKGNDQNVRAHALIATGSMTPVPELETLLEKAIFDRLTMARACAIYAAGKGRYEACRQELARQAAAETHVDMKELAETALGHLDHAKDDEKCCNLDSKIENFIVLGDTRR